MEAIKNNNIKAVIFDFGNVLSLPQNKFKIKKMHKICDLPIDIFQDRYFKYRLDYDKGALNSAEYWEKILGNNLEYNSDLLQILIREDVESWLTINEIILKWIIKLKKTGYKVAILSNMPEDHYSYLMKKFEWLSIFDSAVFSCKVKMIKPEENIYRYCLKELQVEPWDALFIDDSEINVNAAIKIGINSILFKTNMECDLEIKNKYNLPSIY